MSSAKPATKPVVLSVDDWEPNAVKYMPPKVNDRGGKSINLISRATNRALCISTPLMMTWGITDFVDEKTGESDGKYTLSLNFPNEEYATAGSNKFLQKLKDFENQIIDDAVANSELWWGESMSREIVKFNFFSFIKYSKVKDSKKIDTSKPPSIRAKVPMYNGKWAVEIYDTRNNLLFPADNDMLTPIDFVPKLSSVACVLQCGGIWIGGKGWGLTWKLVQCVVKPREVVSVYGKCHIKLSDEDRDTIDTQQIVEDADDIASVSDIPPPVPAAVKKQIVAPQVVSPPAPVQETHVDDSDDEPEPETPAAPVVEAAPVSTPAPVAVKKIVKKTEPAPAPVAEPVVETAAEPAAAPAVVKKRIVKK